MTRSWLWGLGLSSGAHLILVALILWRVHPAAAVPVALAEPPHASGALFRVEMRERPGAPPSPAQPPAPASSPVSPRAGAAEAVPAPAPRREAPRTAAEPPPAAPALEPIREATPPVAETRQPLEPSSTARVDGPGAVAVDVAPAGASAGPPSGASTVAGPVDSPIAAAVPGGPSRGGAPPLETDSATLASVHERLASAAQGCAPAAARRFRLEGAVGVRFCVDASGTASGVQIDRPSGQAILDDATRNCVLPAAAPFPDRARGRCFAVPVRFTVPR